VKFDCKVFKYENQVGWDLYQEGVMCNYYWWINHGEELSQSLQWMLVVHVMKLALHEKLLLHTTPNCM